MSERHCGVRAGRYSSRRSTCDLDAPIARHSTRAYEVIVELNYSYSDLYEFTQMLRPLGDDIYENSWREAIKLIEAAVIFHVAHGQQDTLMMCLFEIRTRFESLNSDLMMMFANLITSCVCEIREHIREMIRIPFRTVRIRDVRIVNVDHDYIQRPLTFSIHITHPPIKEVYS